MENQHIKIISTNRKAKHNYFIDQEFEAGMVLKGTEVKSLRIGKVNLKDSYARPKNGELFIYQLHIGEYPFAKYGNHAPQRPRKLLMHKREINKLIVKTNEKGFSIIPLNMYFRNGKAKITIGLARGKRKYDKRETMRRKDEQREMDRIKKRSL